MKKKIRNIFCILSIFFFFLIALKVKEKGILGIDLFCIQNIVLNGRNEILTVLFKIFTFFASAPGVMIVLILSLFLLKKNEDKIALIMDIGFALAMSQFLKIIFERERPDVLYHLVTETSYSFPSGHTIVAVTLYGFIIYLLFKSSLSKNKKTIFTMILTSLILGVGFSRIYLGVHYASDVLAGAFVASFYLLIFITLKEYYEKKRKKNILLSFYHAGVGIGSAFLSERNMKVHIFFTILVVICGFVFQISWIEWMICIILCGVVISAEIMNTAIETTIDLVMPEIHPKAKLAKDLSAGAVLVLAIISVIIGFMIFLPKMIHFFQIAF